MEIQWVPFFPEPKAYFISGRLFCSGQEKLSSTVHQELGLFKQLGFMYFFYCLHKEQWKEQKAAIQRPRQSTSLPLNANSKHKDRELRIPYWNPQSWPATSYFHSCSCFCSSSSFSSSSFLLLPLPLLLSKYKLSLLYYFYFIWFFVYDVLPACVSVYHLNVWFLETKRGHSVSRTWSYSWFWATEPSPLQVSSKQVVSVPKY